MPCSLPWGKVWLCELGRQNRLSKINYVLIQFQFANNSLAVEGFRTFVQPMIRSEDNGTAIVEKIIETCSTIYDEDRCEAAAQLGACIANVTLFC